VVTALDQVIGIGDAPHGISADEDLWRRRRPFNPCNREARGNTVKVRSTARSWHSKISRAIRHRLGDVFGRCSSKVGHHPFGRLRIRRAGALLPPTASASTYRLSTGRIVHSLWKPCHEQDRSDLPRISPAKCDDDVPLLAPAHIRRDEARLLGFTEHRIAILFTGTQFLAAKRFLRKRRRRGGGLPASTKQRCRGFQRCHELRAI